MKKAPWFLTAVVAISGFLLIVTPTQAGGKKHWHGHGRNYGYYHRGWNNYGYYGGGGNYGSGYYNRGWNGYGSYGGGWSGYGNGCYYRPVYYYPAPCYRPVYYAP